MSEAATLARRIDALERLCKSQAAELAELRSMVAQRLAFDAPAPAVTLTQKRRYEFAAALARPRLLIGFEAHNRETGARISCADYTAAQIERHAYQFARMDKPTRAEWRGDRAAYGLMRALFAQHGAIVQHSGRSWSWVAWPSERRAIAGRIAAALTHPGKGQQPAPSVNV
jgi:hypothetical protein